jgi:hypothetical protein
MLDGEAMDGTRANWKILPGFATTTSPIDITAAPLTNSGCSRRSCQRLARDSAADAS